MSYEYGVHLQKLAESNGVPAVAKGFADAIRDKKVNVHQLHVQGLAEALLGRSRREQERKLDLIACGQTHLLEATEAVDASAFSNVTGQLLVTAIKEKYESPEFIADKLVKNYPNPGANIKEHKIPGLSAVLDKGDKLEALQPYPQTKFSETWVTMPAPERRGMICALSKEMVFSDLTGQAQESAGSIGEAMAYLKEERVLKVVLGIDGSWFWNGNTLTTYVASAGTGNYVNLLASTTVTNYTHVNDVEQLFWKMVDPITGRRIYVRPDTILCSPGKRYDLDRILHATEVRDATTGVHNVTGNPIEPRYKVLTSPIAEQLLLDAGVNAANTKQRLYFLAGNKAFGYRQVEPFKTMVAPAGNPMEFNQDVVLAVRVSEWGVPFVFDPHYAVKVTSE